MASARVGTLEDEVATLEGTVRERDEALSGTGRDIETLRAAVHDKDEALRASEKAREEVRDEVVVGRPMLRVNLLLCSGLDLEVAGLC
jgi:chromosome segregation ATPase